MGLLDSIRTAVSNNLAIQKPALAQTISQATQSWRDLTEGQHTERPGMPPAPANPARVVQQAVGGAMALFSLPVDLLNTGFAVAPNAIAQALPEFPAATVGCLYVGPPHGHLHPPSFTPPVTPVPVPLPSLGPVLLGTCIQVWIGGMPAARAGDLGFAVTCCGINPLFEIFLGSSKVFIGGTRAARMYDVCKACLPSMAGPVRGMAMAMRAAGVAVGLAGAAADGIDAANANDPDVAAATALSAAMGVANVAADAATLALTYTMGVDLAVPPSMGMLMLGVPTVQIGGFPMINFPNPAEWLLRKIAGRFGRRNRANPEEGEAEPHTCPVGR